MNRVLRLVVSIVVIVLIVAAAGYLLRTRPGLRQDLADRWTTAKVSVQYAFDRDVPARGVRVTTRDGIVTVIGEVDNERTRAEALAIARTTDGVQAVRDRLWLAGEAAGTVATVGEGGTGPESSAASHGSDDWISTSIRAAYFDDPAIRREEVKVFTEDRVVVLSGEVSTEAARQAAVSVARATPGVEDVRADGLRVRGARAGTQAPEPQALQPVEPSPEAGAPVQGSAGEAGGTRREVEIQRAVTTKLESMSLPGADVQVTVRQGEIVLRGSVPDTATRDRVLAAALEAGGGLAVVDRLAVRQ